MSFDLASLVSMGAQAAQIFGKGGSVGNIAGNAAKVFSAFSKYPKTMEGLQQALNDYGVNSEQASGVIANLTPEQREFIEKKLPGSLNLIEQRVAQHTGNTSDTTATPGVSTTSTPLPSQHSTYEHSDKLKRLLERSKPLR